MIRDSERVVFWGCDPVVTNDIDWYTTIHNYAGYLRALKKKGTKTISVNPVETDTAEYMGSEWIHPNPGTDPAVMAAMIYELDATDKTTRLSSTNIPMDGQNFAVTLWAKRMASKRRLNGPKRFLAFLLQRSALLRTKCRNIARCS